MSRILTTEDLINLNRAVSGSQKQNAKDAAASVAQGQGTSSSRPPTALLTLPVFGW